MKVLLTGATGFVGSHILDALCARGISTAVLLRPTSNRQFLAAHLGTIQLCLGSISDRESLASALAGVTHVVHCADSTKTFAAEEFDRVNHLGTRQVLAAANQRPGQVQRLLYISSLAAVGPASPDAPAREEDLPRPVSDYGQSKLAAELAIKQECRAEYVILRPPGVYGPRDSEFLRLFKAVRAHFRPDFGRGSRAFSLVFVRDLAEAVLACLTHPAAAGKTYHVAFAQPTSVRALSEEVARQMGVWTVGLPLPVQVLWPICLCQELWSRATGRASVLNRQKYAELKAPGWVCDTRRLERELGFACGTSLRQGIAETLAWCQAQGCL
jgi:nucleoside-diphosphate-sugar epimerase